MTDKTIMTPVDRAVTAPVDAAPWYLNGTLSEADREWFEAAMRDDPQVGPALDFDRRLVDALAARADEVPADIGWDRLIRQVRADAKMTGMSESTTPVRLADAVGSGGSAAHKGLFGQFGDWLAGCLSPGVGMAMAAVLVAQTMAIGFLVDRQFAPADTVDYRAVGSSRPVPVIRALIVETTPEKRLREALIKSGLSIVAGPDTLGQYLLAAEGDADLVSLAKGLRDDGVLDSFALDQQVMDR